MSDDDPAQIREVAIDERVVDEVAADSALDFDELVNTLVVLDAELRGHHSDFESGEYVTVDGRRAYAVTTADWKAATTSVDFDDSLVTAAREAHTRQAKLLFDSAVESTQFDEGTIGVVIGVDTAEEMV